jgi:hypothetical protein
VTPFDLVPDLVPTSSPGDLVPSSPPLRGDEDKHLVPDLVPGGEQASHSWTPIDLVARAASPPEPPSIIGLLYPGYNHLLSGEPEALKTWLMIAASVEEMRAGRGVVWVDGDDVGPAAVLERLRLFGADDETIAVRFAYFLPDEPLTVETSRGVLAVVRSRSCRLAVFDGFNPLLVLHDLDPNKGSDVEKFYRLPTPIRRQDFAVVVTDNVVKCAAEPPARLFDRPADRRCLIVGRHRRLGRLLAAVHLADANQRVVALHLCRLHRSEHYRRSDANQRAHRT